MKKHKLIYCERVSVECDSRVIYIIISVRFDMKCTMSKIILISSVLFSDCPGFPFMLFGLSNLFGFLEVDVSFGLQT